MSPHEVARPMRKRRPDSPVPSFTRAGSGLADPVARRRESQRASRDEGGGVKLAALRASRMYLAREPPSPGHVLNGAFAVRYEDLTRRCGVATTKKVIECKEEVCLCADFATAGRGVDSDIDRARKPGVRGAIGGHRPAFANGAERLAIPAQSQQGGNTVAPQDAPEHVRGC